MIVNQKAVGHFLDMHLFADSFQIVNIKIYNIIGEMKLSLWEELNKGDNNLVVDVSSLMKGPYRMTISYLNQKLKEDRFTLY
ncbi:MAG: hypothetical protein H7259_06570 [Cytophagales bacterium]|nr:hypothetical protein [Cytophaga sp.]